MNKTFLRPEETGRYTKFVCLVFKNFIVADCGDEWLVFSIHRPQQWLELWWQGDVGNLSNFAKLSGCQWLLWLSWIGSTSSPRWGLMLSFPCWGPWIGFSLLQCRWLISFVGRWCRLSLSWEELVAPTDVLPVPVSAVCWFTALYVLILST